MMVWRRRDAWEMVAGPGSAYKVEADQAWILRWRREGEGRHEISKKTVEK